MRQRLSLGRIILASLFCIPQSIVDQLRKVILLYIVSLACGYNYLHCILSLMSAFISFGAFVMGKLFVIRGPSFIRSFRFKFRGLVCSIFGAALLGIN